MDQLLSIVLQKVQGVVVGKVPQEIHIAKVPALLGAESLSWVKNSVIVEIS